MGAAGSFEGTELRSEIDQSGRLRLALSKVELGLPGPGEIVVRVEASPVNPSDLGSLVGPTDPASLRLVDGKDGRVVEGLVPPDRLAPFSARFDLALPVGAEGCGVVVAAGAGAERLLGRTVATLAGGMYSQFRRLAADEVMVLPDGLAFRDAAACYVNPLTALGMVETMRHDGHSAMIHTAAASNLGRMLVRLCAEESVPLINVVRTDDQVELLRCLGAKWVLNSTDADFDGRLTDAAAESGATIAFDATGGGTLASRLLLGMESALSRGQQAFGNYGSSRHKQVYTYGNLDPGPTVIERRAGMAWSVGGWLLPLFLDRIGPEATLRLQERVVTGLHTTFASNYTKELSLDEMLDPDRIRAFMRRATGEKYLIRPNAA